MPLYINTIATILAGLAVITWFNENKQHSVLPSSSSSSATRSLTTTTTTSHYQQTKKLIPNNNIPPKTIRHAVVHIGPPKTATTTLQYAMTKHFSHFAHDNYYTKGPFHEFAFCTDHENDRNIERCNRVRFDVQSIMRDAATNYNHLFISSEGFGYSQDVLDNLADALRPWNDVSIVLTYRRFFDWLPSKYNQFQRTTKTPLKRGGKLYPSLVQYLSRERILFYYTKRYVTSFYDFYTTKFDNVRVFNMHRSNDLVSDFYCSMVPDAEYACRKARKSARKGRRVSDQNHSVILDYDRLIRGAYLWGLLDESVPTSEALMAVRHRQEVILGMTNRDWPQECMGRDILHLILKLSLKSEKRLFPNWFKGDEGEGDLRERFEVAARTKFCNADVGKVLMDQGWQDFFRSLRPMRESHKK